MNSFSVYRGRGSLIGRLSARRLATSGSPLRSRWKLRRLLLILCMLFNYLTLSSGVMSTRTRGSNYTFIKFVFVVQVPRVRWRGLVWKFSTKETLYESPDTGQEGSEKYNCWENIGWGMRRRYKCFVDKIFCFKFKVVKQCTFCSETFKISQMKRLNKGIRGVFLHNCMVIPPDSRHKLCPKGKNSFCG